MTRREKHGATRRSGFAWLGLLAIPLLASCVSTQRHFETPEAAATVVVPEGTRGVALHVISTGHCTDGRDADEFITKDNVVLVDGQEVFRWRPWRDDCTEFRAVNPYCAKWSDGSWSSDYSRSGWCPGDVADPVIIDLSAWLTPGPHEISFFVEGIRPADAEGHHGYWRVSASVSGWR